MREGGGRQGGGVGGVTESVIPIGNLLGADFLIDGGKLSSQVPTTCDVGTDRPARKCCVALGKPVNLSVFSIVRIELAHISLGCVSPT